MEQLTTKDQFPEGYAVQSTGRMIEVAMLTKKVKLKLSKEQLSVVARVMFVFLSNMPLVDIECKSMFYSLWALYEGQVRNKMLSINKKVVVSLDIPHAWALMQMFHEVDLGQWPYENTVAQYIIGEIDHQTA